MASDSASLRKTGVTDSGSNVATPDSSIASPSPAELEEAFAAILANEKFSRAVVLRNLLRYLWEHHGQPVSEYAVGTEALQRKANFDPKTDATVRVNVARLRGKLAEFYAADGQNCPLRLSIPLNSHHLEYRYDSGTEVSPEPAPEPVVRSRSRVVLWLSAAVGLLAVGCAVLCFRLWMTSTAPHSAALAKPFLWKQFLGNGHPVTLVIPTPLFQVWNDAGAVVRDPDASEFSAWRESKLLSNLSERWGAPSSAQGFTSSQDLFATLELQRYLVPHGAAVTVVGTKELEADSLHWCNVILIGLPNSSFQLQGSLGHLSFAIDAKEPASVINKRPRAGEPARYAEAAQPDGAWRRSYGILALLPGRTEQTRRLVMAGRDTRLLTTMIVSEPRIRELEREFRQAGSPAFFETVLEMTSGSQKLMRIRPVAFRPIDARAY
jgi:hypothetical protein